MILFLILVVLLAIAGKMFLGMAAEVIGAILGLIIGIIILLVRRKKKQ